ncbi:MAG: outer membrane lipoprotein carrier protein LolA [Bacteroidales bacterium]|nr:outer membrane lipoprotein carrier protein LolA [Bacteroidales bacterium]
MRYFLSLFVMLFTLAAFGQGAPSTTDLLSKMRAAIKQHSAIEVTFNMSAKSPEGELLGDFAGTVQAQGNAFKMVNPQLELFCDGKSKWILSTEIDELTIFPNDTSDTDLVENPIGFLTSLGTQTSSYSYSARLKESNGNWVVELIPSNKKMPYKSVLVGIDKNSNLPVKIEYTAKDGSSYVVVIKSFKPSSGWPETNFIFPASRMKGLLVTDLR